MKGYLANGLFSESDRMYNEHLANLLRKNIKDLELYVPQENEEINDKNSFADSINISRADFTRLRGVDFLVAVLDGNDNGVSNEIGIAFALSIPIYGLLTDVRQQGRNNKLKIQALIDDGTESQFIYHNLMETGLIKDSGGGIFDNTESLINSIREDLED